MDENNVIESLEFPDSDVSISAVEELREQANKLFYLPSGLFTAGRSYTATEVMYRRIEFNKRLTQMIETAVESERPRKKS